MARLVYMKHVSKLVLSFLEEALAVIILTMHNGSTSSRGRFCTNLRKFLEEHVYHFVVARLRSDVTHIDVSECPTWPYTNIFSMAITLIDDSDRKELLELHAEYS